MRKRYAVIISLVLALAMMGSGYAQFSNVEDAIRYRKSVMFMIAHNFKSIGAEVQKKAGVDQARVASDAQTVAFLATLPWEAMTTPGSDQGDTTMSSAVLTKTAQFKREVSGFEDATQKMAIAAETGEIDKVKGAFGAVAGTCKSCHGGFRKR